MTESANALPSPLSYPPFALYWFARGSTTLALQMQAVAVGWQIYDLTGSALDLGWVGLAQFLPMICLAIIVGHIADRYDRRQIARLCQIVAALAAATLALGSAEGRLTRDGILAIILVFGAARAFEQPSLQALVPSLVPRELVPRALAWASSANQTATITGPALSGLIYAAAGPAACYAICSTLFLLASLLLGCIRGTKPTARRETISLAS